MRKREETKTSADRGEQLTKVVYEVMFADFAKNRSLTRVLTCSIMLICSTIKKVSTMFFANQIQVRVSVYTRIQIRPVKVDVSHLSGGKSCHC